MSDAATLGNSASDSSESLSELERDEKTEVTIADIVNSDPRKRILVINDDGIEHHGLRALALAMSELGEVCIVAPQKSCTFPSFSASTSGTFEEVTEMMWPNGVSIRVWQVNTEKVMDCLPIALFYVLPKELGWTIPDLVVSGINRGRNVGTDLLYSGTLAAACGGTFDGIPSIAFSLAPPELAESQNEYVAPPFTFEAFQTAAIFAKFLCYQILKDGLPKGVTLNVNIPHDSKREYAVTKPGHEFARPTIMVHHDPDVQNEKELNFGIAPEAPRLAQIQGSDLSALSNGLISVTPVEIKRNLDCSESSGRFALSLDIPSYRCRLDNSWPPQLDDDSFSDERSVSDRDVVLEEPPEAQDRVRLTNMSAELRRVRSDSRGWKLALAISVSLSLLIGVGVGLFFGSRHRRPNRSSSAKS